MSLFEAWLLIHGLKAVLLGGFPFHAGNLFLVQDVGQTRISEIISEVKTVENSL